MPTQPLRVWPQTLGAGEVEQSAVVLHQTPANRGFIFKPSLRNVNHVDPVPIIDRPEPPIKHPVGVSRQREAVAWVVVSAFRVLVDVCRFDRVSS